MSIYDFKDQTKDQLLRDKTLVDNLKESVVLPLLDELSSVVQTYRVMDEEEKIRALLSLNAKHAPQGDWLLLDFGGLSKGDAWCAFSGQSAFETVLIDNETKAYVPRFITSLGLGTPMNETDRRLDFIQNDTSFKQLPIVYRIGMVAYALRENVFCSLSDACRFAAGIDGDLKLWRSEIEPLISANYQRFGWRIEVRDVMPSNELAVSAARKARALTQIETSIIGSIESSAGQIPIHAEYEPKKRRPRGSTNLLIEFIENYLPSKGCYVGRKRVEGRKKISWQQAYDLFDEKYPQMYVSVDSFKGSYTNAKTAQKRAV